MTWFGGENVHVNGMAGSAASYAFGQQLSLVYSRSGLEDEVKNVIVNDWR